MKLLFRLSAIACIFYFAFQAYLYLTQPKDGQAESQTTQACPPLDDQYTLCDLSQQIASDISASLPQATESGVTLVDASSDNSDLYLAVYMPMSIADAERAGLMEEGAITPEFQKNLNDQGRARFCQTEDMATLVNLGGHIYMDYVGEGGKHLGRATVSRCS